MVVSCFPEIVGLWKATANTVEPGRTERNAGVDGARRPSLAGEDARLAPKTWETGGSGWRDAFLEPKRACVCACVCVCVHVVCAPVCVPVVCVCVCARTCMNGHSRHSGVWGWLFSQIPLQSRLIQCLDEMPRTLLKCMRLSCFQKPPKPPTRELGEHLGAGLARAGAALPAAPRSCAPLSSQKAVVPYEHSIPCEHGVPCPWAPAALRTGPSPRFPAAVARRRHDSDGEAFPLSSSGVSRPGTPFHHSPPPLKRISKVGDFKSLSFEI